MKYLLLLIVAAAAVHGQNTTNPCEGIEGTKFVENTKGCAYYYTCVNGTSFEHFCPDGFWFNEAIQKCDLPSNVECFHGLPPVTNNCPEQGVALFPHPHTCSRFFLCSDGDLIPLECDKGEEFSTKENNCVAAEYADCQVEGRRPTFCPVFMTPNEVHVIPNKRDCGMFYVCTVGRAFPLKCADGMEFNAEKNWCEPKATANCQAKMPPGFPEIIHTDDCPADSTVISTLPHPETCSAYFVCFNGESTLRLCRSGLEYDHAKGECNFPELANCVIPPPSELRAMRVLDALMMRLRMRP